MASSSLPLSLCCLVLLFPLSSLAQNGGENRRFHYRHEQCRFERINGLQPRQRIESEGGVSEYFDADEQQLKCAGVTVIRRTYKPGGLFVPSFSNSPGLIYVIEGSGIGGLLIPGCPESFQSFQEQSSGKGQDQKGTFGDAHQKIIHFRQGDVIADPAGFAHWCYNTGDRPLVLIIVLDNENSANQLDNTHRQFMLAGSLQKGGSQGGFGEQQPSGGNFLRAFDARILAAALGIPHELANKIQREDQRGEIILVKEGLKVVRPSSIEQRHEQGAGRKEEEEKAEREMEKRGGHGNSLDQNFCAYRLRENIDNPQHADFFNPQAGWLTRLSSLKLPVLRHLRLSARRGVMRPRATLAPFWVINAHSIIYVTKGRARVQVASDEGRAVLDGELRQGQLLVVPQNFVALVRAEEEGFEWVAFNTNENAMESQIAGQLSVFKGLPADVIANVYKLSKEEALKLKFGRRDEIELFPAYGYESGRPFITAE